MFNSLYFLHIPKTGGRYFFNKFIDPISEQINILHDPKKIDYSNLRYGQHLGWSKDISDDTYVVTILRDPIKRAVSFYTYILGNIVGAIKEGEEVKNIFLYKKYFIDFLESSYFYHDHSSKHLMYDFYYENNMFIDNNLKYKMQNLDDKVKRCNLILKLEDLKKINDIDICNKISNDLKLNFYAPFTNNKNYKIKSSDNLYNSLTENDKKYLYKFLEIDYHVYNSANFWQPGK